MKIIKLITTCTGGLAHLNKNNCETITYTSLTMGKNTFNRDIRCKHCHYPYSHKETVLLNQ